MTRLIDLFSYGAFATDELPKWFDLKSYLTFQQSSTDTLGAWSRGAIDSMLPLVEYDLFKATSKMLIMQTPFYSDATLSCSNDRIFNRYSMYKHLHHLYRILKWCEEEKGFPY